MKKIREIHIRVGIFATSTTSFVDIVGCFFIFPSGSSSR